MEKFQSTPPRGGRRRSVRPGCLSRSQRFNPRPRAGRRCPDAATLPDDRVSIHAPARRGDPPVAGRSAIPARLFQSTPPRGARPREALGSDASYLQVSIHAPARQATVSSADGRRANEIEFQSTPPRGAATDGRGLRGRLGSFNPRPRAGGDPDQALLRLANQRQGSSFNPRPRAAGDGEMSCARQIAVRVRSFNPRPRARRRIPRHAFGRRAQCEFQSTPPRGGRPSSD